MSDESQTDKNVQKATSNSSDTIVRSNNVQGGEIEKELEEDDNYRYGSNDEGSTNEVENQTVKIKDQLLNKEEEADNLKKETNNNINDDTNKNDDTYDSNEESSDKEEDTEDSDEEIEGNSDETDYTSDSEESDDEEETEPPLLKFSRIKFFEDLPKRDAISACYFGTDIFAFGTHMGLLHITKSDFTKIRTFKCHRSSILSIYIEGENIATASIDGTVVIGNLSDPQNLLAYDFKRPVNAVVLHNNFETSKIFVSGGMAGEVILTQRNWLGNRSDVILTRNHGPIVGIFLVDDILIWMNDAGITFNDIPSKTTLLNIEFPSVSDDERPDLFKPFMHKIDSDRVVVGWGRNLWSFKLTATNSLKSESAKLGSIISSAASSLRVTPEKTVVMESHHISDLFLAGIASFKGDQLICLGFSASQSHKSLKGSLPELSIIDLLDMSEVYSNDIVTKNYENLNLNDYHLGTHIDENDLPEYYLICAEDRIKINTLSLLDHFDWYKNNHNLSKAWEIGKLVLNASELFDLGVQYINSYVEQEDWSRAAQLAPLVYSVVKDKIDSDGEARVLELKWEKLFEGLLKAGNADCLVEYLPIESEIPLFVYEESLMCLLKKYKLDIFQTILKKWPIDKFDLEKIELKLEEMKRVVKDEDKVMEELLSSLITINLIQERYSRAIPYMIDTKDNRTFEILRKYKLTSHFVTRLKEIILIPLKMNKKHIESLPRDQLQLIFRPSFEFVFDSLRIIKLSNLVEMFNSDPELQKLELLQLEYIFDRDPSLSINHEDLFIILLAKYEKDKLLPFLKTKNHYDVKKAIKVCQDSKELYHELIYLWGKVGETKRALSLIIDELKEPDLAIHFVKSWGDPELIDFLISYSMDKPDFIRAILESVDESRVLHIEVLKNLPENLEISDLPQLLKKVTKEVNLDFTVQKTIDGIIEEDTQQYAIEWLKYRLMGKLFEVI